MPGTFISKRVGPGEPNLPDDVSKVRALLNKIPADAGGPPTPLAETAPTKSADDPLFVAIRRFQTHHKLVNPKSGQPWGYVDAFGSTLEKLDHVADTRKDPLTIQKEVGPGKPNRPDDVRIIRQLLNEVPIQLGGPEKPLPDNAPESEVFEAIKRFQTAHRLGRTPRGRRWQPYGFIGPEGSTLPRLNAAADRAMEAPRENRNAFVIPQKYRYSQGDPAWNQVTLNDTNTIIIDDGGCALSAHATAFAARGVKLPDTKVVAEQLKKKKIDVSKWTTDQLQEVTPLTLNAWLTAYNSHGFVAPGHANMVIEQAASRLTGITYEGRYKLIPAQLRRALDSGRVILAHLNEGWNHFVVLTGHNGGTTFFCHDVGFRSTTSYEYSEIGTVVVYR